MTANQEIRLGVSSTSENVRSPLLYIFDRLGDTLSALTYKAAPIGLSVHTKEQIGSLEGVDVLNGTVKMRTFCDQVINLRASLVYDLNDPI